MEKIKVMLDDGAYLPEKAHDLDAGFDLRSPFDTCVPPSQAQGFVNGVLCMSKVNEGVAIIDTGVHVQIPKGYAGMLKSKSGLNVNCGITSEGLIDAGYTGPIVVKLYNHTDTEYSIKKGDKITQLVIVPIHPCNEMEQVSNFEITERGNGGFGSTGK